MGCLAVTFLICGSCRLRVGLAWASRPAASTHREGHVDLDAALEMCALVLFFVAFHKLGLSVTGPAELRTAPRHEKALLGTTGWFPQVPATWILLPGPPMPAYSVLGPGILELGIRSGGFRPALCLQKELVALLLQSQPPQLSSVQVERSPAQLAFQGGGAVSHCVVTLEWGVGS